MKFCLSCIVGLPLFGGMAFTVIGASVQLTPSVDTSLIEAAPGRNNGGEAWVLAGTTQNYTRNRGLFGFDLTRSIPANSIITSVQLTLDVTRHPIGDGYNEASFGLFRVYKPWGEGNKIAIDNNGGQGAPADENEATWNDRFTLHGAWTQPGGLPGTDFNAFPSAEQFIRGTGDSPYTFISSPELIADVQSWVNNPQSNYGWLLLNQNEGLNYTARRFGSSESEFPPLLDIEFEPIPEPRLMSLGGLALVFMCCTRRKMR